MVKNLPSPNEIGKRNYALSSSIYDRNGKLLYEIYRDENRKPVQINNLPEYVAQATVAIEDRDFYHHHGISIYSGILRAIKDMIKTKKLQGGSTITQQLVKTSLLTSERTIERKLKEIIVALWTERLFSKNEILEMYLNQVPYGGSSYGIEQASKTYFNKSAKDLTLSEAALLAGLPQLPSLYSPYVNPDLSIKRRNSVLDRMYEEGYISNKIRDEEKKKELSVLPPRTDIHAPHFVFYARDELEKNYGIKQIEEGGLHIKTSLDLTIQQKAEEILKEELAKLQHLRVSNGAILITRPSTGEILAMVGSKDYFEKPYGAFNVTTAERQPGSSIKPLLYAFALERGYTAASIIHDTPSIFKIEGTNKTYRPVNYDNRFHGSVTFRNALANSYNIPAVKILETIGVTEFINYSNSLGITSWKDPSLYGLSLTLGGGEVKMTEMANAFSSLANLGYRTDISPFLRVSDTRGKTLEELTPKRIKVLNPATTYIISDILSDNNARQAAFGTNSLLRIPDHKVSVKTGTTNEKKDNWTIGYTPEFMVLVWVGNNDNTPMHPYLTSGITGAAPIWHRTMKYLLDEYNEGSNRWYEQPSSIVTLKCRGKEELFIMGSNIQEHCRRDTVTVRR